MKENENYHIVIWKATLGMIGTISEVNNENYNRGKNLASND